MTIELSLPLQPNTRFSHYFLTQSLKGTHIDDGWYKSRVGYYYLLLYRDFDPLIPLEAGAHGAQITPLMSYIPVGQIFPLFISDIGDELFRYYGTYKVISSDRLGRNEIFNIPDDVKHHWARRLGTGYADASKSEWVVRVLKDIWPKVLIGWWDAEEKCLTRDETIKRLEVDAVYRPITTEEAQRITEKEIIDAFDRVCDLWWYEISS